MELITTTKKRKAAWIQNEGFLAALVLALCLMFALREPLKATIEPSDRELKALFFEHESDFQRLVEMCRADSHLTRIAQDFTWLEDNTSWPRKNIGISKERWDEYRKLFTKLRLKGGVSRENLPSPEIYFIASAEGIVPSGSFKGYVYSPVPLSPTVDSLDGKLAASSKGSRATAFKALKGTWYLYREDY